MTYTQNKKGFTLAELLIALVVTSIILTAVSTLAFALSSAKSTTDNTSRIQAQVRMTMLKIQELIRNCNLICSVSDEDIAIWSYDNNNDNKINIDEIIYIECGSDKDHLFFCNFPSNNSSVITLDLIDSVSSQWWSAYSNDIERVRLLPECSNVTFQFDKIPPQSNLVCISFDVNENGIIKHYQVNTSIRGRKGNLLDENDSIVSDDD